MNDFISLHRLNSATLISPEQKYKIYVAFPGLDELFSLSASTETLKLLHNRGIYMEMEQLVELLSDNTLKSAEHGLRVLDKNKIRIITIEDKDYPAKLKNIYAPPICLYLIGKLPNDEKKTVAIVGARECSEYGKKYAEIFGRALTDNDYQVVSGMAKGIDSYAQWAADKKKTFAVLGSGVDVPYPRSNRGLYKLLCDEGGVLSEVVPGSQPIAVNFPRRNRIISGLSDGILLVEARYRSGSLITVTCALEQGKEVFVLPGRADDILSQGCLDMIKSGAVPVTSPGDIFDYF